MKIGLRWSIGESSFFNIYFYLLFIWLCWVLAVALKIFSLPFGVWDLQLWRANSWLQHAGSSFLTKNLSQASCTGSSES